MKAVIAVIFLGVGVWYTIRNIRALYQLTMGDSGDKHKKDASGETGSKRNLQNHSTIRQSFDCADAGAPGGRREKSGGNRLHTADLKEDKETDDSEMKRSGRSGNIRNIKR